MIKKVLIALLVASACYADEIGVNQFKYVNTNENSTIIDPYEAQDLLNVDITPGGKSVKKRAGYGLYKTPFTESSGIHGGFHGFDSTGNDVQIWGSSRSIMGIVADATPVTIVSSMTLNATIDCADTQGFFYCVNSSRDFFIKTNGAALTTWQISPLGTIVEATPDRIAVAGVSASPNTIFVSGSNSFLNFTAAPLVTDPFTEVIAAPGSKITHLRWGCQKLLWWKDQSFGYVDFEDQYTAQIKIISDNIGTLDNTSAIDPGGSVWFRGQDGHLYEYNCSGIIKQTIEITPQIQASGRRVANSWTQTTQSDWQTGSFAPSSNFSTSISAGDITVSSYTTTDTAGTDFNQGTGVNVTYQTGSIIISTNSAAMPNGSFETGDESNWSDSGYASGLNVVTNVTGTGGACNINSPQSGTYFGGYGGEFGSTPNYTVSVWDANTNVGITTTTLAYSQSCSWTSRSLSLTGTNRRRLKVVIKDDVSGNVALQSDPFVANGTDITYYTAMTATCSLGNCKSLYMDNFSGGFVSSITSATYTSRTMDTGITSDIVLAQANWTASDFTPYVELQTSANGSTWTKLITSTGTNGTSNRYVRYISSFTPTSTQNVLTTLDDVTIVAKSTGGIFYSQVNNAPNLNTWNSFSATNNTSGGGISYFVRASTGSFTIASSTPNWVAQTNNASVNYATGTYMQARADFTTTSATATFTLSDFAFNWFEGSATDQAYMLYYDNAIWASVAYGTGVSSNTYIFRRDLINNGWGLYGFGAGGMIVQNNHLYFGSVGSGSLYQFGTGNSDNGTAITAFWKSKDFTAKDPFVQMNLLQIDTFAKKNANQSITNTYTLDTSTTTSYSVNLSTTTQNFIQSRKLLPAGKNGYTFNVKFGDTSSSSDWEVFGFRVMFNVQPWKPTQ